MIAWNKDVVCQFPRPPQRSAMCRGGFLPRGKTDDLVGHFVGEHGDNEVGQQPCSGQPRVCRGQCIDDAQCLEALEAEFNLPARMVDYLCRMDLVLLDELG